MGSESMDPRMLEALISAVEEELGAGIQSLGPMPDKEMCEAIECAIDVYGKAVVDKTGRLGAMVGFVLSVNALRFLIPEYRRRQREKQLAEQSRAN